MRDSAQNERFQMDILVKTLEISHDRRHIPLQ
jgi:hypothetical protein